jgi:RimJ/RimL family protein N-acetyltransferase
VSQASYIRSAITDSDDETWVYDLEGRPAGFVVLKMDDAGIADIDLLAVDPAQQGQGIATMLNRFAFERSQEESMSYVVVATADDPGHAPARRSYESAGFVPMPIQWNLQIIRLRPAAPQRLRDVSAAGHRTTRRAAVVALPVFGVPDGSITRSSASSAAND